jgi:hypothetical protein
METDISFKFTDIFKKRITYPAEKKIMTTEQLFCEHSGQCSGLVVNVLTKKAVGNGCG